MVAWLWAATTALATATNGYDSCCRHGLQLYLLLQLSECWGHTRSLLKWSPALFL